MKRNKDEGPAEDSQWLEFLNLGWIIAGTMTITVGGGLWLDKHFKTTPILLLIGTFIGFGGCGYSLYRMILKLNGKDSEKPLK